VNGGEREFFGLGAEARADGVLMDVIAVRVEALAIGHTKLFEAVFPDGHFGFETEGESALYELHRLFNGDVRSGREDQVEVVGHKNEGVELVTMFRAVVAEELEEKVGVRVGLKEAAPLGGDSGDEVGAEFGREEFHAGRLACGV